MRAPFHTSGVRGTVCPDVHPLVGPGPRCAVGASGAGVRRRRERAGRPSRRDAERDRVRLGPAAQEEDDERGDERERRDADPDDGERFALRHHSTDQCRLVAEAARSAADAIQARAAALALVDPDVRTALAL